jgi:hypothetical protein
VIPIVAEQASLPSRNRPMDPEYEQQYKANYRMYREMLKKTETAAVLFGQQFRSDFDVSDAEREQILEDAWNSCSEFRFMGCFRRRTHRSARQ